MRRLAIGYSPSPDELDRPLVVFMEAADGVWVHARGEPAPRVIADDVSLPTLSSRPDTLHAGDPAYFDAVLDSYSTSCVIRTVVALDADFFSALLASDESWEALPRPGVLA